MTEESCFSVELAYAGNKGYIVYDFQDDQSCETFSLSRLIDFLAKLDGMELTNI